MKVLALVLGVAISVPFANAYTGDLTHYTTGSGMLLFRSPTLPHSNRLP